MVRALLEGRKVQTRRLAWHRVKMRNTFEQRGPMGTEPPRPRMVNGWPDIGPGEQWASTPWQRVQPGDRLWVRESFAESDPVGYMADYPGDARGLGWRPSIHMPRWASRLTLVVTEVRLQKLQEISEQDALAEGMPADPAQRRLGCDDDGLNIRPVSAVVAFSDLWDLLHGAGGWAINPELVALTFTMHRCNIDAMERAAA